jgi:hypothetical protein
MTDENVAHLAWFGESCLNNISVMSWQLVLLVEETEENHQAVTT